MTPQLYIAKSGAKHAPALPLDAVTRTFGIFGQRGTGKTNTAVVMVEEMVRKGAHVCVLDPKGDWWGITRAGEGGPGLPGIVLGGDEGDVPLEETAGQLVAELVADRHWPVVVIDLGSLRKGARRRFMADFLEELYERNREALHLVFEEAHQPLPQMPRGMDPVLGRVLGAAEDIVTLGRKRGIGVSLVSQRFATVNATVREQAETLLLHRLTGPLDRKAAKGWIEANGDAAVTQRILDELPGFQLGEALMYSPGWLGVLERVRIKARRTFDSSATPEVGAAAVQVTERAPVDLAALRRQMAETVERAKANDPRELRKRIEELQREADGGGYREAIERIVSGWGEPMPAGVSVADVVLDMKRKVKPERILVPDRDATAKLIESVASLDALSAHTRDVRMDWQRELCAIAARWEEALAPVAGLVQKIEGAIAVATGLPPDGRVETAPARPESVMPDAGRGTLPPAPSRPRPAVSSNGTGELTGPQQRVLDALAWWEALGRPQPTKGQVGFIAGYRVGKRVGGTYGNILGQLRAEGLLDYPQASLVELTDRGREKAWPADIDRTSAGLQRAVMDRLDGPEQRVLSVLIRHYPGAVSKQEAGAAAGYTVGDRVGGTFGNILGRLRSLGLIDYPSPGSAQAQPVLFVD